MSKRRKHEIPDFSSHKPSAKLAQPAPKDAKAPPPPAPRMKPQATSAKSGRRGQ